MTIFAVLCLIIFALLTLSTAKTNLKLSQKSAASVQAYYQADCEAEEIYAKLQKGQVPEGVTQKDNGFTYQCDISKTQAIQVEIQQNGQQFQILQWKKVYTGQWTPDDSIDVWDGSFDDN